MKNPNPLATHAAAVEPDFAKRRAVRITLAAAQTTASVTKEFVREPELRIDFLGGVGATTLRRMIAEQNFPAPIKFSERILMWSVPQVREWLAARQLQQPQVASLLRSVG